MKMKTVILMSVFLMLTGSMSSCSDSDDENLVDNTSLSATPLQKAFYMVEDDSNQPLWLQEKIKQEPYLKVYHSNKKNKRFLLEYPSRAKTIIELYDEVGKLQEITQQEELNAEILTYAPWICTHVYTYPIEAGTEEWKSLSVQERHERLQLSDKFLNSMRTEDLIEVCLEYPFALDFFAFDDFQTGFMSLYNEFNGLRELLSRNDLAEPFLLYLDVNWQKADLMKSKEPLEIGAYTLLSIVFKYMLAQEEVINQMNRTQVRQMLDLCMRNHEIEKSDSEMWSGMNLEAIWYVYAKVIHNKGGFRFKDDKEKRMFNEYIKHPNNYLFEEGGVLYVLLTDDFKQRVMEYVENFR